MTLQTVWIINASPYIGLTKAGLVRLLDAPGRTLLLPDAVAREILAGPTQDTAVRSLTLRAGRRRRVTVLPPAPVEERVADFHLDAGEAAVLTAALARPGSLAVIDDGQGRRAANRLGVPLIGSVGVLLLARRAGTLAALTPALHALRGAGIFLPNDSQLRQVLEPFGEEWPGNSDHKDSL